MPHGSFSPISITNEIAKLSEPCDLLYCASIGPSGLMNCADIMTRTIAYKADVVSHSREGGSARAYMMVTSVAGYAQYE